MSFKTHMYSILVALLAALVPAMFNLADNNVWSYIQLLGVVFTPGLSFALFIRKWGKNISDDIAFALSVVMSLAWVMFFVAWNSIRGENFESDTLLFSIFGAAVIFIALGSLPNGKDLNSSEPAKYKIPVAISSILIIAFGTISYNLSDVDSLFMEPGQSNSNIVSLAGRSDEGVTLRIYNPEDKIVRTTLYFVEVDSNFTNEIFTDILGSGENYITLKLPSDPIDECKKYKIVYSTSSNIEVYYSDIFLASEGCYSQELAIPRSALPTNREKLLDYIYESGLK